MCVATVIAIIWSKTGFDQHTPPPPPIHVESKYCLMSCNAHILLIALLNCAEKQKLQAHILKEKGLVVVHVKSGKCSQGKFAH